MRISFDFDFTLSLESIQHIAKSLMKDNEIFIVTSREPHQYEDIIKVANDLGIMRTNIFYTNGELKYTYLVDLEVDMHFDDDETEILAIREKCPHITALMVYDDLTFYKHFN